MSMNGGGRNVLARTRRRCGIALTAALVCGGGWWLSPGLPVWWGPSARPEEKAAGRVLFIHEWQPRDPLAKGDGLGPVFNDRSCVACHFQGGVGGGGDNMHNVLAFEALPTRDRPELASGLVHKYAVLDPLREDVGQLRQLFPIVPGGLRSVSGCQIVVRDFDPVRTESVNTTALFGAGWIDRIDGKAIVYDYRNRSLATVGKELLGDFRSMPPGRPRVLPDGRLGKFGWKGQFATLEEFVAAACANEIGLGNPQMAQAKPRSDWTYLNDERDLDDGQFRSLVAYVSTLARPEVVWPDEPEARQRAGRGQDLFGSIGCASCHTPEIGGVSGVYSDFLLHRLEDPKVSESKYGSQEIPGVPLPEAFPEPAEWKTPPLWGVAASAPYLHDGSATTLEDAILRHKGDATVVTQGYRELPDADRAALLCFLATLQPPREAEPAAPVDATSRLALAR